MFVFLSFVTTLGDNTILKNLEASFFLFIF